MFDVSITGQGFYLISPGTTRGRAWARKHLSKGERTKVGDAIACDDGRACREIVAGMVKDGLAVQVNGVDMKGFHT
jgi:hypothetical protein